MPQWVKGQSGNPTGRSHHAKGEKDYRWSSRKAWEPCPICGVVIRQHKRCAACEILIGSGHEEPETNSDGLCSGCVSRGRL